MPVTFTVNDPAVAKVQDSFKAPEPIMVVGSRMHPGVSAVRLTTSAKPLTADIIMVELPTLPTFTKTLVGLALSVKSCAVYVK